MIRRDKNRHADKLNVELESGYYFLPRELKVINRIKPSRLPQEVKFMEEFRDEALASSRLSGATGYGYGIGSKRGEEGAREEE